MSKKKYLHWHAVSDDNAKHAALVVSIAKSAAGRFKVTKPSSVSEMETLGLLVDVHFLITNGISINKAAPLHSLVDYQLLFYGDDNPLPDVDVNVKMLIYSWFPLHKFLANCQKLTVVVIVRGNLFIH